MKYIDVLFISSMEYNIYISTGRRLTSATSHIVLNAIEYIFKNECDVQIRCLVLCWWSAALLLWWWLLFWLLFWLFSSKSLPVRHNAIPMLLKNPNRT